MRLRRLGQRVCRKGEGRGRLRVRNAGPLRGGLRQYDRVHGSPVLFCTEGDVLSEAGSTAARRAGTTAAYEQLLKYPGITEMPIVSSCYWNNVHGSTAEDIQQDEEGVRIMRVLGHNMAWLLRCIEAGKAAGVPDPRKEPLARTNFIR